jgi:hypothetical protein
MMMCIDFKQPIGRQGIMREFRRLTAWASAVGLWAWVGAVPAAAETVAEFFDGRAIAIHMGFPGGGFFASAQLVGKHMGKHIPGNPKIVFLPRPGRMGTAVLDFLTLVAPRDGTHLAMPGSLGPWLPLQTRMPVKYDPLKMSYIGNVNSTGDTYLFVRADAGIRTLADLRSKPLRLGNARGAYRNFVAALNNILGARITYVGDYPAHRDAFMAMLRGDTQGVAGAGVTAGAEHRRYFPTLLKDGKAIPILRYTASTKSAHYPNVILAGRTGTTETQTQALEIAFASQVLDRPLTGPPGIPADRLKALQDAFVKAMRDPALIAEARAKKLGIENPMSGPDMKRYIEKIYALPDAAKALVRKALADTRFVENVSYTTFKAELAQVKPKGRSPHALLMFKGNGKPIVAHLDGRTTEVTASDMPVKIPPFKARALKPGMKCEVSWTGPGTTASKLVCSE